MKWYEHPAYIGFYNQKDVRKSRSKDILKRAKEQFESQGFDDSVTWSLDNSLIQWLVPRLKRLIEIQSEVLDEPELMIELIVMYDAFEFYLSDDFDDTNIKHIEKMDNALDLLKKNFRGLWW
jgi:hypothetical protein